MSAAQHRAEMRRQAAEAELNPAADVIVGRFGRDTGAGVAEHR